MKSLWLSVVLILAASTNTFAGTVGMQSGGSAEGANTDSVDVDWKVET